MAILNVFKKNKPKKPKEVKREVKKPPEEKKEIKAEVSLKPKKLSDIAYRVLKEPQITEKATDLIKSNKYVFKVWPEVNKVEIKKAIEDLYGVDVISVKVIKVPPKRRTLKRISGWRKGYKKAIIRIKEGQKIEVLPR